MSLDDLCNAAEDTAKSLAVTLAANESLETGKPVKVPILSW